MLAFTGHRPEKLPWGQDESDPRCAALKLRIRGELRQAIAEGVRDFACGMARGCDFYFAEAVLGEKELCPDIRLFAYLPCPGQPDRWASADRIRYRTLLAHCDKVRMVQDGYTAGCMLRRNRIMVDEASALMSVWDGSNGGTGAAVAYAKRRGRRLIPLWL